jgi:hypothetical protein
VAGLAFCDYHAIGLAHYLVSKPEGPAAQFGDVGPDNQYVIIVRRRLIATIAFSHDQECIRVLFHVAIRKAARAAEFRASNLKPDQVVGVIDHTHLVGFGIANAEQRFVPLVDLFELFRT